MTDVISRQKFLSGGIKILLLSKDMASLSHNTSKFVQKAVRFKPLGDTGFCNSGKCQKYYSNVSNFSNNPFKHTCIYACSERKLQLLNCTKKTEWYMSQRYHSSQGLIWEENGQTLIRSPHKDVNVAQMSFAEYMFSKLDEYKHLECMVDHNSNRTYTAAQLKEMSVKVASALVKMGYKKGDVILIFATNCVEYSVVFMACCVLGVIVSTANPIYTPEELATQLTHSEAKGVFTMVALVENVTKALEHDPVAAQMVKDIITIDGEAEKCRPLKSLLEDNGKDFPENVDIDPLNDVATLPYSSGTTGLPKGVMLTHSNIIANLQQLEGPMNIGAGEDVLLGLLPFYHIYGLIVVQFGALSCGTRLILLPKFEPVSFLESIQKHKMTYMHIVPPLALFLAKQPLVDKFDLRSLKTLVSAAAPLGSHVTAEVEQRLGVDLVQAYGLTETSPASHYDSAPSNKGTVGKLLPSTLAKIVDPVSERVCQPGEEGELLLKGPQVMKGYLKNQQATDCCIENGWFYSGDLGQVDREGYFTITDRLKELIKYKGFQVAPAELEALLTTHPAVQDAAVVGLKMGEEVGEVPKAFIVLKPDTDVKPLEVEEFVAQHVAQYKRLRGGVEIVSSIPKTASGKILRRFLREQIN